MKLKNTAKNPLIDRFQASMTLRMMSKIKLEPETVDDVSVLKLMVALRNLENTPLKNDARLQINMMLSDNQFQEKWIGKIQAALDNCHTEKNPSTDLNNVLQQLNSDIFYEFNGAINFFIFPSARTSEILISCKIKDRDYDLFINNNGIVKLNE